MTVMMASLFFAPQVLPAYLNALRGKGVHVVTVNDYLAKRDSEWVGQIHKFLGLTIGLVQQGLDVSFPSFACSPGHVSLLSSDPMSLQLAGSALEWCGSPPWCLGALKLHCS